MLGNFLVDIVGLVFQSAIQDDMEGLTKTKIWRSIHKFDLNLVNSLVGPQLREPEHN